MKKKEECEQELENIGSIREMQIKESEISGKISGIEKKIQYAEIEKVTNLSFPRCLLLKFTSVYTVQELLISGFVLQKSIKDKLPDLEQDKRNITEESRRINLELSKVI